MTEMNDRIRLRYVEEWKEEEDLKRQLRSTHFARLAELMERAVSPPRAEFALATGVRGLEYAGEVRGNGEEASR
jgi:quinol monooxygenase YgiN